MDDTFSFFLSQKVSFPTPSPPFFFSQTRDPILRSFESNPPPFPTLHRKNFSNFRINLNQTLKKKQRGFLDNRVLVDLGRVQRKGGIDVICNREFGVKGEARERIMVISGGCVCATNQRATPRPGGQKGVVWGMKTRRITAHRRKT